MDSKNYKTFNFPSGSKIRLLPPSSKTTQDNGYLMLSKDQWKRYQESSNNQKCLFCELEKDIFTLQGFLGNSIGKSSFRLSLYYQFLRYGKNHFFERQLKSFKAEEKRNRDYLLKSQNWIPIIDCRIYKLINDIIEEDLINRMIYHKINSPKTFIGLDTIEAISAMNKRITIKDKLMKNLKVRFNRVSRQFCLLCLQ